MYTASQVAFYGPYTPISPGVNTNKTYSVDVVARASSIAAGREIDISVELYGADLAYIGAVELRASSVLTAADTWESLSVQFVADTSTYKYMRILITKSAADFSLYIDSLEVRPTSPFASLTRTQTPTAATWTAVTSFAAPYGANDMLTSTTGITSHFYRPTIFMVNVLWNSNCADGDAVGVRIKRSGTVKRQVLHSCGAILQPGIMLEYFDPLPGTTEYSVEVYSTQALSVTLQFDAIQLP
jgi:hypothetical protein